MDNEFSFQSTWPTALQLKGFGLGSIVWSIVIIVNSISPSSPDQRLSMGQIPFHLFLWLLGFFIYFEVCEVEIGHGEFRFRRLRKWKSVPLASIVSVRLVFGPIVYVKIKNAGKTERLVFNLGWTIGQPYPPPVIGFLKGVAGSATSRG